VVKGRPDKDDGSSFNFIARCNQTGAPALASVWKALPSDTAILNSLYLASARVKDARLYLTMRGVATNRSAPTTTRVASLRALARLVRPNADPSLEMMRPRLDPAKPFQASSVDHFDQYTGAMPLPATYTSDIQGLMKELSTDPDVSVRAAAVYLSTVVLSHP
jgi:hypothetical protein